MTPPRSPTSSPPCPTCASGASTSASRASRPPGPTSRRAASPTGTRVELGDFFDQADAAGGPPVSTVISNPPYIPAPDRDILMPELWGGVHGNDLMLQLLKAGYENVIAAVASYSDPGTTVRTAADLGYRVANFLAMGLDYGPYSNEPKVRDAHPAAVRRGPRLGRPTTATWSRWPCSPGTPTSPATAPTSCSKRCSLTGRAGPGAVPRGRRTGLSAAAGTAPGRGVSRDAASRHVSPPLGVARQAELQQGQAPAALAAQLGGQLGPARPRRGPGRAPAPAATRTGPARRARPARARPAPGAPPSPRRSAPRGRSSARRGSPARAPAACGSRG